MNKTRAQIHQFFSEAFDEQYLRVLIKVKTFGDFM